MARGEVVSKSTDALRLCRKDHGGSLNSAIVYGHHGSVRVCIRLFGTNRWVYDPRWEVSGGRS